MHPVHHKNRRFEAMHSVCFLSCYGPGMVFGYYLGKLARKGDQSAKQALSLFNGMNAAVMKMVDLVMIYHPIGL